MRMEGGENMLKEFYNKLGRSPKNFQRWAKKLLMEFVPGIDYEIVNGDYSFEATAELVVILRLKEKYPNHVTYDDVHTAFAKAGIRVHPYDMLEKEHLWPKVVHEVHSTWRSRRANKFAKLEDYEVPDEFHDVVLDDDTIELIAPKSMLPGQDFEVEESSSPVDRKTERIKLVLELTHTI
jgi:hypothetical protein